MYRVAVKSRQALLALLSVVLFAGIVEVAAWFAEGVLYRRGVVYRPPPTESYRGYAERRDPFLGWPSATSSFVREADGSRPLPAFPDTTQSACVSLYGESFTRGAEVDDEAAWSNQLARRVGCRVANYAIGGYGTDQAFLSFRDNHRDRAPVVLLGHMSENIARNLNQFRQLLYPHGDVALKPRFVLNDSGELELIPLPTLPPDEYEQLGRHPEEYLAHETFLPGSALGPTLGGFPHTLTMLSALTNRRLLAVLAGSTYWHELYRPEHPAHGLAITAGILQAFVTLAAEQGRHGGVLVFPTYFDLANRQRGRPWPYQPLLDELARRSVPTLNVGDGLVERLGSAPAGSMITASLNHYNEQGNLWVAEIVGNFVEDWVRPKKP